MLIPLVPEDLPKGRNVFNHMFTSLCKFQVNFVSDYGVLGYYDHKDLLDIMKSEMAWNFTKTPEQVITKFGRMDSVKVCLY